MTTETSAHFNGNKFFNPNGKGNRTFGELARWLWTRSRARWPKFIPNPLPSRKIADLSAAENAVTFIGHSTFLIQVGGVNILTDPVFSMRASPVQWAGPKRVRLPGISLDDLPTIHLVLVSHNHYDHMDLISLRQLAKRFQPEVITTLGNKTILQNAGFGQVVELDWWQSANPNQLKITCTPAQHFSARAFRDRNRTLWGSFVVEARERTIFFAADTGYGEHLKEIGKQFPAIDLALLPIGAYEPRWFMQDAHMNPTDAVQAFLDLNAKRALGMHFGTFQLTDEGVDEPVELLKSEMGKQGVGAGKFGVLQFGETMSF